MIRHVLLSIGFILLCTVSAVTAQGNVRLFPAALMHTLLLRVGYVEADTLPMREYTVSKLFVSGTTIAGYEIDYSGRLQTVMVCMRDPREVAFYQGLGIAYLTVQTAMGKLGNLLDTPSEVLARKGMYLMDAITHNLKHLPRTQFTYDDMYVLARKDERDRSVMIILAPRF